MYVTMGSNHNFHRGKSRVNTFRKWRFAITLLSVNIDILILHIFFGILMYNNDTDIPKFEGQLMETLSILYY